MTQDQFHDDHWISHIPEATVFKETFLELLNDWATRLDLNLYTEAMTFIPGGGENVLKRTEIGFGERLIESKQTAFLTKNHAFRITMAKNLGAMERHLKKFLHHTRLEPLHWVNLDNERAQLKTLLNKSSCP